MQAMTQSAARDAAPSSALCFPAGDRQKQRRSRREARHSGLARDDAVVVGMPRASSSLQPPRNDGGASAGDTPKRGANSKDRAIGDRPPSPGWRSPAVAWAEAAPVHPMPPTMQRMRKEETHHDTIRGRG